MCTNPKLRRRGRPEKRWRDELGIFLNDWIVEAGERTFRKHIG